MKAFLRQSTTPLTLLILLHDTRELEDDGAGLVGGTLSDHRSFILFHQDDLLPRVPSLNFRFLFHAWDKKQAFENT
jgi:hypothetical protein